LVRQGLLTAPASDPLSIGISKVAGQHLAYYKAVSGVGVLALRGWHCFGTYGSSGESLFVSAEAIDTSSGLNRSTGLSGAAIQLSYTYGDTSGSILVAETVARVFPAFKSRAIDV